MTRKALKPSPGFERRVLLLSSLAAAPWVIATIVLLWNRPDPVATRWILTGVLFLLSILVLSALHSNLVYPLRTLSNLIASIREEDYSFRGRRARESGAMGEVMSEVNELTEVLRAGRLSTMEASALVRTVIEEIDSAIFAFDHEQILRLVNRAAERILDRPAETLSGRTAAELGLDSLLAFSEPTTTDHAFPGGSGRFGIRRTEFRQGGRTHQLLVITDLSRALREEEREAWKRLLRVLGHELNNSLAPIKSIAASLETLAMKDPAPVDLKEDLQRGLAVIRSRVEALTRFMDAYSRLARLPRPKLDDVDVGALVRRVVALEPRRTVEVVPGPEAVIRADPDQLEQLLINLVRNAVDASLETEGGVDVTWNQSARQVILVVRDEGPGLSGSANLFVPFFTTKPGGTGIGLALSRQIAEAHGGTLTLTDRKGTAGCEARLELPAG